MDVSAVAQVTQGQSAVAVQDSSDSASTLFAYLLQHRFDNGQSTGTMINTQPMLDMVGATPAYVPPPTPPALPQHTSNTSSNGQSQSNQSNNGSSSSGVSTSGQSVANTDSNSGGNSGSGTQTDNGNQGAQQNSSGSNSSNSDVQTTAAAAPSAQAPSNAGQDAATEATVAVLTAQIYFVQQPAQVATTNADPTFAITANLAAKSGPAQTADGPSLAPTAANAAASASTGQAAAAGAAEDLSAPVATPWSLNFLATASASSPQIAQQAASLSQLTGGSSANVSVQSTSGSTVTSPSTSTLVPDAVLAISGFLQNGQQDASTGDGSGSQLPGQQTGTDATDTTQLDAGAQALAEEAQALVALSAAIQTVAQDLAASAIQPQSSSSSLTAAAPAAASAGENPLPQPTVPSSNTANASGFAAQLGETDQTQAPQSNRPIALPSAVDQIKMQIEKGLAQGSSTIKVQLTPENMGRVEVKLEVQNGSVKATITADRPETLAVLKADQQGLVQSLQDAGLNADSNSLSFFLRGDQQRQFAQFNRQGRSQSGGSAGEDDPLLAGVAATSGVSATGNGNLDISV